MVLTLPLFMFSIKSTAIAIDNQESVILLLLDLSAAFDTAEIDSLFTFKNLQPRAELR